MSKVELETVMEAETSLRPIVHQDPLQMFDRQLKQHFALLYMIKPGNFLQSKLRMPALYTHSFLSALFHEESIKALFAIRGIQILSFLVGWYLVIKTYVQSLSYHELAHRLVKVDTFVVQSEYQRQPTLIDFSLASCSWKTNLLFVMDMVQGFAWILASIFGFFDKAKTPKVVSKMQLLLAISLSLFTLRNSFQVICLSGLIIGVGQLVLFAGDDEDFSLMKKHVTLVSSLVVRVSTAEVGVLLTRFCQVVLSLSLSSILQGVPDA
eukprot:768128-Hanusia_phi.AAC.2